MAGTGKILVGKSEEVLKGFADNSVDSCVTDPPYGLKFMGKKWDYEVPKVELWKEVFRVLKPGAHILVACGTRTQHRMAVNIEDAGFEIRDVITWHYGSGFPKSLDISKAIDKQAGAERDILGEDKSYYRKGNRVNATFGSNNSSGLYANDESHKYITEPSTEEAKQWNGWGTALKPSTEFWTLARKPLSEDTVAANVLKYGTGGINIDGCRISLEGEKPPTGSAKRVYASNQYTEDKIYGENKETSTLGRFPANLILDEFMASELDKQSGISISTSSDKRNGDNSKGNGGFVLADRKENMVRGHDDSGGASRFFYCAKASRTERNKGLKDFYWRRDSSVEYGFVRITKEEYEQLNESDRAFGNIHPTVKPVSLMKYLIKLITPKDGVVIDMFAGSGTTGVAADELEIGYVLIDKFQENCEMAEARIPKIKKQKDLFS